MLDCANGQATEQAAKPLWSIYRLRGTPAQFVGLVYDAPDEQAAIAKAIGEFKVRPTSTSG